MHNLYHLGDNIFSLIFINNIVEHNNVNIEYSCRHNFLSELSHHNYKDINLSPLTQIYNSVDTWIQGNNYWGEYCISQKEKEDYYYYDEFYLKFYSNLSNRNELKHSFNDIEDTLYYHPDLEKRRYDDYDFLIINSRGGSGQFQYIPNDFKLLVNNLNNKGYKLITTEKIDDFDCTRDTNMNLKDIANLAIGCKNVIAVHTAPMVTALNKISIKTVNKWILLNDKNISYRLLDVDVYDDVKKIKLVDEID